MNDSQNLKIAVLISGTGRTLKNLLELQSSRLLKATVELVIASTPTAKGIQFANEYNVGSAIVDYKKINDEKEFSKKIFDHCREQKVDLVVMAGFLKKALIPSDFENKVINIHPSLIPKFSGKGFYGIKVHRAVIEAGESVSGCTVHFVDDQYDHGPVIAQQKVVVHSNDLPETLAARVFAAECELLPAVINQLAESWPR